MDLQRVKLFLQVVDAGTLSAATKAAHLTQPAISRSLKLLEQDLGVSLFTKVGRGLVLSAAGRALVPRARALLEITNRAAVEVHRAAERAYYDVRIGTIDSVAMSIVPNLVAPLRKRFPELVIRLAAARTPTLLERIRSGDLDLAIIAHSGPPLQVVHRRVGPYRLQFFGRKDRFQGLRACKSEADLEQFPVVEIDPGVGSSSVKPPDHLSYASASTVATVKALVLAGFGVGDLPSFMLDSKERALLCTSAVPHDPQCALYLVRSAMWTGPVERAVEDAIAASVTRQTR